LYRGAIELANVNANINVTVTTQADQIRRLTADIAKLNKQAFAAGSAAAAIQRQNNNALIEGAKASGQFSTSIVPVSSAVDRFSTSLENNKLSLGQYTRYAASQLPGMRKVFTKEFDMINSVAQDRVRRLNTQFISLGQSANGMQQALALTPRSLDQFAAKSAIALQRQQIFNRLLRDGSTSLLNWGKNTQWAGRQLMVGFTIPLGIFAGQAAKVFREMEAEAINFKKVYGDMFTSDKEVEQNLSAIRELSKELTKYGQTAVQTMKLANTAAQAGFRGADLMAATTQATRLAILGQMEQTQAIETTISMQTAFQQSNEEVANSINFLNAVENQTILSLEDVSEAIPRVASVIKGFGGDVEDLAVLLVAMKEGGVSASEGANALKNSMARLVSPTKAAREITQKYGIDLDKVVSKNQGEIIPMFQELATALEKIGGQPRQEILSTIFGKFQYARIGTLMSNIARDGSQASTAIKLTETSVRDLAATADRELSAVEESISTKFTAALEKAKIALAPVGEQFLKAITPIVEIVGKVLEKFNEMPDTMKTVIVAIAGIVGGIAPVFLMMVGLVANLIANLGKFILFLRKSVAVLRGNGEAFKFYSRAELDAAAASATLEGRVGTLTGAMVLQQGAITTLKKLLNDYVVAARAAAVALPTTMGGVGFAGRGAAAPRMGGRGGGFAAVAPSLPRVYRNEGGPIFDSQSQTYVPGIGNTDTVPAMLTPGEFVINKKATASNLPLIKAINDGKINIGAQSSPIPTSQDPVQYARVGRIMGKVKLKGKSVGAHASNQQSLSYKQAFPLLAGAERALLTANPKATVMGLDRSMLNIDDAFNQAMKTGGPGVANAKGFSKYISKQKNLFEKMPEVKALPSTTQQKFQGEIAKQISQIKPPIDDVKFAQAYGRAVTETRKQLAGKDLKTFNGAIKETQRLSQTRVIFDLPDGMKASTFSGAEAAKQAMKKSRQATAVKNGEPFYYVNEKSGKLSAIVYNQDTGRFVSVTTDSTRKIAKSRLPMNKGGAVPKFNKGGRVGGQSPQYSRSNPLARITADRAEQLRQSLTRAGGSKSDRAVRQAQNQGVKDGEIRIGKNGKTYNVYNAATGTWMRGIVKRQGKETKLLPPAYPTSGGSAKEGGLRRRPTHHDPSFGAEHIVGGIPGQPRYGRLFVERFNKGGMAQSSRSNPFARITADRAEQLRKSLVRAGGSKSDRAVRQAQNQGVKDGEIRIGKNGRTYNVYNAATGTWMKGLVKRQGEAVVLKPPAYPTSGGSAKEGGLRRRPTHHDPSFGAEHIVGGIPGQPRYGRLFVERPQTLRANAGLDTVPGTGNKDTVPAMLTPGESVINKKATQKNLPLIKAINAGAEVKYYNTGTGRASPTVFTHLMPPTTLSEKMSNRLRKLMPKNKAVQATKGPLQAYSNFGAYLPEKANLGQMSPKDLSSLFKGKQVDDIMKPMYKAIAQQTGRSLKSVMKDQAIKKEVRTVATRWGESIGKLTSETVKSKDLYKAIRQTSVKDLPTAQKAVSAMRTPTTVAGVGGRQNIPVAVQQQLMPRLKQLGRGLTSYARWGTKNRPSIVAPSQNAPDAIEKSIRRKQEKIARDEARAQRANAKAQRDAAKASSGGGGKGGSQTGIRSGMGDGPEKPLTRMQKANAAAGRFGMGAGMALSMGAMLPMMGADEEGKWMGMDQGTAMMGMMGAGSLMSMASMFPKFAGPIMGVAAIAATVGIGLKMYRESLDNGAKKAAELGASMGSTANSLNTITKLFGEKTPAQRQAQMQLGFTAPEQEEAFGQFQNYLGSEEGQKFIKDLENATSAERFTKLSDYMKSALASGLMDRKTAENFTKVIATSLNDPVLGTAVLSSIRKQKTGPDALKGLADERVEKVEESGEMKSARSAIAEGEISVQDAGFAIGSSIQIIQDYANVIAQAREQYASGELAFNDYINTVREAQKAQSEYSTVLRDSVKYAQDQQAARLALDTQLLAAGYSQEQLDALTASTDIGISTFKPPSAGDVIRTMPGGIGIPTAAFLEKSGVLPSSSVGRSAFETSYIERESRERFGVSGKKLNNEQLSELKEEAAKAKSEASKIYAEGLPEDLRAAVAAGMDLAQAAAIGQEIMNSPFSKMAEVYNKRKEFDPVQAIKLAGFVGTSEKQGVPGLEGKNLERYIDVGIRFAEYGGSIEAYQAFFNNLPENKRVTLTTTFEGLTPELIDKYMLTTERSMATGMSQEQSMKLQGSEAYQSALSKSESRKSRTGVVLGKGDEKDLERWNQMQESIGEFFQGREIDQLINIVLREDPPNIEERVNEIIGAVAFIERNIPKDIQIAMGIDTGNAQQMTDLKDQTEALVIASKIIESLPEGQKEIGARLSVSMVDGKNKVMRGVDLLKETEKVTKAIENLGSDDIKIQRNAVTTIIQSFENAEGERYSAEEAGEYLEQWVKDIGGKRFSTATYGQIKQLLEIESEVSGAEEALELLRRERSIVARFGGDTSKLDASIKDYEGIIAAASGSRKSLFSGSGGGSSSGSGGGGGGGEKSIMEQLKEQLKQTKDMFKFISKITKDMKPAFKGFIAGPFAQEFIEYLQGQGEKAIKELSKNAKKFKEAYRMFVKEQSLANATTLKIQRAFNKKEVQLSNQRQNFLAGFTGTTAQRESIMSRMGEEDLKRFLEYSAMTQKERKKLNVEEEFQQLQKNYNQLARQAPKLAANDQLEAFRNNVISSKEEVETFRILISRGFSPTFARELIAANVGLDLLKNGSAAAKKEVAELVAELRRVKVEQVDEEIELNFATESEEFEKAYNILRLIPGANENVIQGIIRMGIAAGSLPPQIMKAANAFSMLQAKATLTKDAFSRNISLIEASVSGLQAQIERISRIEIRPIELEIKIIESGLRNFEKQIRSLQKTIQPLEKEIKEFEKQIKPLEKQIKAYDKQIRELEKTNRPLEKENEALQEIEKEITEEFEKREKALDQIEKINARITAQQRAQLSIARAIADGDIYAATAAVQEYRAEQAQMNAEQTRDALREGFENRREQITKKIEENEKSIKATNELIESIQERIETIQENIESIQEKIEERQERIALINEDIANIQERIADEQDRIRDLQEQIEASKERQLALEEKIYKLQLLRSMLDTASQIRDAVAAGDPEMAEILQAQLGAQRDVASGMDFSDLGINTDGIFNLVAQAINPERIAEAVKTQISAGLLKVLDSMGIFADNWVATGTAHMAEMEKIFQGVAAMPQEALAQFSPGMQAFLQAIRDKAIEFPKTAEELQAALISYGVKGSDVMQLLMSAEGLGIVRKVDETGQNATENVEGAERRGKKNIDTEAEEIAKGAGRLNKALSQAEKEYEKGNITFRQAAIRILSAMAEAIGSAAIAKVDTTGFNNALKAISTALQTTINEFSTTLSTTLNTILLIGKNFSDSIGVIEKVANDFGGIMVKVSEGFDTILTNVGTEFGVIGADFNTKFQGLMSSLVDAFAESVKTEFGKIVTALQTFTNEGDGLPFVLRGVLTALSGFATAISNAVGVLNAFTNAATEEITRVKLLAIGEIQNQERISIGNIASYAATLMTQEVYAGGIIKAYAMGGKIQKYPMGGVAGDGGRDSVGAMLTPGEFIVRKSMVKKYGQPFFESINQGSFAMPRYNMPESKPTNIQAVMSTTSINAPVYNNYDMDFSIQGANASADEIANKVMVKIKQVQSQGIRSNRGY
jgi:TP901 family phage tail tape measure protein